MEWELFTIEEVIEFHDLVLNPQELSGLAVDKSLDSALMRVENFLRYGLIQDVYGLAASYALVISTGHCFNDANKRTAYITMIECLKVYGIVCTADQIKIADIIIDVAQGHMDEVDLARWLLKNTKEI